MNKLPFCLTDQPLMNLPGVSPHPYGWYLKGTDEIQHLSLEGCGSDPIVQFVPCDVS